MIRNGSPPRRGRRGGDDLDIATEVAEMVEALITGIFALAGWLLRQPALVVPGVVIGGTWWLYGWRAVAVAGGVLVAAGVVWWLAAPGSFARYGWGPLRAAVLRMVLYGPRWPRWARGHHLILFPDETNVPVIPHLRRIVCTRDWDEMRIRMLPGQTPEDYERAAEGLAAARRVARCAVREVRPGIVSVGFQRRDSLRKPVPLPAIPDVPGDQIDLASVPIGQTEFGGQFRLPLLGTHVLGAGETGAGKGSLLWGPIRQVAPAIRDGQVRISMIDPKGGMEAEWGKPLFYRYARDTPEDILELLRHYVDDMGRRKTELRGRVRKVVPSREHPLELLIVDELAAITRYMGDRKMQIEAERLLGLVLTQGRALAHAALAFVQEPTKEAVPMRSLFPHRVGLRLDTPWQTNMILGDGAWLRGAWCDRIPRSTPGVGYIVAEGVREPLRVRGAFTPDDEIQRVAETYALAA